MMRLRPVIGIALCVATSAAACGDDAEESWILVEEDLPGALLSVWGTSGEDVWVVGGDPDQRVAGNGPLAPQVMHWDGSVWDAVDTGTQGSLWWVFGFEGGAIYLGGDGATILQYRDDSFGEMATPGTTETVFGIWGCAPDDVWAVGGNYGGSDGAFAWHFDGESWTQPADFPSDELAASALWKVSGRSCDDVWMVGTNGATLYWDGDTLTPGNAGISESLFTIHCRSDKCVAVGGFGSGRLVENDGSGWVERSPEFASGLVGVCGTEDAGVAVGWYGEIYTEGASGWTPDEDAIPMADTLHACWIDPSGEVWAVGGQVQQYPLIRGLLVYRGSAPPTGAPPGSPRTPARQFRAALTTGGE
jgi:hypothetical protein